MKTVAIILFILLLTLCLSPILIAEVYNVPDDYETISAALNEAADEDTILISDGEYTGNGNVNLTVDDAVVIMSVNGPGECIINCERADNTNAFVLHNAASLIGLTITQGTNGAVTVENTDDFLIRNCVIHDNAEEQDGTSGGGIVATTSSGLIEMCIISDNEAIASGPGVFVDESDVTINNCIFTGNNAERFGGAILVTSNSTSEITNCIFDGNSAGIDGGAIAVTQSSEADLSFCTVVNNEAGTVSDNGMGGGFYKGSDSNPTIINCIFWGNESDIGQQIYAQDNGGEITISYCDVEGGDNEDDLWDGEEILDEDPLLTDGREPDWGVDGYFLDQDSPCIDAGSGSAEDLGMDELTTQADLSPDEDQVDLGYHYDPNLFEFFGSLFGYVRGAADESPIEGASVTTTLDHSTITNEEGYWEIENVLADRMFDITATAEGWNDMIIEDQAVGENEDLEINFDMLRPIFRASPEELRYIVGQDSGNSELTIHNDGDGYLEWTVAKSPPGGGGIEAWDRRLSYPVGEILEDPRLEGVVFIDNYFYISGANQDDPNQIYVMNRDGELVDSYNQIGEAHFGMKDLAWDGEYIWGSGERNIYGFTTEGDEVANWVGPFNTNQALAWDSDHEILWISAVSGNSINGYDRDGQLIGELDNRELRIYGLAYWSEDPDGFQLYTFYNERGRGQFISKIDLDTDSIRFVCELEPEEGGNPRGSFITNQYDGNSWVFLAMINDGGDDRIDVYHLSTSMDWIEVEPRSAFMEAEESIEIGIYLDLPDLSSDTLECDLIFTHNALGGETIIPIMIIFPGDIIDDSFVSQPSVFKIYGVYPNPFNSTATVLYNLPFETEVTAKLYNINGSEVSTLLHQNLHVGMHQIILNGSDMPAGLYLLRLETDQNTIIRKVVLVK